MFEGRLAESSDAPHRKEDLDDGLGQPPPQALAPIEENLFACSGLSD
ncbi:hypothetical protein [Planobispora longispora]|nr:hypothetical protein [Planobispora longispora]